MRLMKGVYTSIEDYYFVSPHRHNGMIDVLKSSKQNFDLSFSTSDAAILHNSGYTDKRHAQSSVPNVHIVSSEPKIRAHGFVVEECF